MKVKKGREGFESYYGSVYGERWEELREALLASVRQVARLNRFATSSQGSDQSAEDVRVRPRAGFAGREALLMGEGERLAPRLTTSGVFDHYVMDAASIFPAVALDCQPGEEVLDLCAAPGGKSLILAESLFLGAEENSDSSGFGSEKIVRALVDGGVRSRLVCNEMSDKRRGRLRAVLEDYLPKDVLQSVSVKGFDGTKWCLYEKDAFDRILLDAPCSGERHLLESPEEMKLWSPARSKNLAVRQYALLASALAVVRPGGRIVYSTCSISPLENDAVIARLLKKREGEVRVLSPLAIDIGEPTELGWSILPDRTGFGPIYFAAVERVST